MYEQYVYSYNTAVPCKVDNLSYRYRCTSTYNRIDKLLVPRTRRKYHDFYLGFLDFFVLFLGPLSPFSESLHYEQSRKQHLPSFFATGRKAIRAERVHTSEGTLDDRARETIARHTPVFVFLRVPFALCPASRTHDSYRRWF